MADENDESTRAVKLDLLNKEHQSLTAAGQQYHRTLIWVFALSAVALALSFGLVSIAPQMTLGGMTISVSQPDLLLGLACIIFVLFWYLGRLNFYAKRQRRHIAALYNSLGYSEHTDPTGFAGFVYPNMLTVVRALRSRSEEYATTLYRERPLKMTVRQVIGLYCWRTSALIETLLLLSFFFLPLIVGSSVTVNAWQHHVNRSGLIGLAVVLLLIYVAAIWAILQSGDKRELADAEDRQRRLSEESKTYLAHLTALIKENWRSLRSAPKTPSRDTEGEPSHEP